ncbi:uncharacterized protein N7459_004674 [Penicillium hispanicum]|uniref:uncharacterized protein n=1 Tax=Penicillium hispanicum TaxID=1080232 RepID=UPI002541A2F9|nr:uncharacterized protein N7459_004674 [Penicillium hispanicum]KAJ5584874.1 hypothetical protein N7459_004674 [Penicillium hispanicum]
MFTPKTSAPSAVALITPSNPYPLPILGCSSQGLGALAKLGIADPLLKQICMDHHPCGIGHVIFELFDNSGGTNTQASTSTPGSTNTTGNLFGNTSSAAQSKPGGLFGGLGGTNTQQSSQNTGSNMFSGLGGQQQSGTTGSSLFGNSTTTTTQPQSGGLFGSTPGTGTSAGTGTTQSGTGGGLFGSTLGGSNATQTQAKPAFGGLGGAAPSMTSGLFGNTASYQQQQQQQQQAPKPTLSLFGNQNTAQGTQQPLQQSTAAGNVVPGVKVDISNLLPTTKFESCIDEIRNHLEMIDNFILNQIKVSHEVADMLPTIEAQGSTIPNDVDFVKDKLETIQHALENDAGDIDQLRGLVTRDAAEAQVAFRAIDTLKLPLQYQSTGGGSWWSVQDQQVPDRRSLRSARKNTLALPDDVEVDPATATSVNGVPVNLVDYFSQRSDEMGSVVDRYKGNIKDIEDHLHGVELTLSRQINEFVSSRSRDGTGAGAPRSAVNDLAAVLGDVEAGIMGVASRLGGVSEQVQEVSLGPLARDGRLGLN